MKMPPAMPYVNPLNPIPFPSPNFNNNQNVFKSKIVN